MSRLLKIIVDNRIRFNKNDIDRELLRAIRENFIHRNPEYYKAKSLGFSTWNIPQVISTYTQVKDEIQLPRGGINKLKALLEENGVEYEIEDRRVINPLPYKIKFQLKTKDGQLIKPDKFQKKQINYAIVKQQGVLVTPTAGGKTVIMSLIIEKIQQRTLVIVHTSKLLNQWVDFLSEAFNLPKEEIGVIGGGKFIVKPLTVGLVQSVHKKVDKLKYEFGCIMLDESHHCPAPTFMKAIDPFPAKYRLGCTGTDYRKDQKQFLMWDILGNVIYRITDENLREVDRIVPVKIKIVKTEFEYKVYDKEGNEVFVNPIEVSKKLALDAERNLLIYQYLKPEIDKGHFCMLLTDRLIHAHHFKSWLQEKGIDVKLMIGGKQYEKEGELAKKEIEEGKLHCIVGINQASAEGINIPRLDRGFIITPSASNKSKIVQQIGRFKRKHPDKKDAIVYYFWDYKMYPRHADLIMRYFGKQNVEIIN